MSSSAFMILKHRQKSCIVGLLSQIHFADELGKGSSVYLISLKGGYNTDPLAESVMSCSWEETQPLHIWTYSDLLNGMGHYPK